MSSNDRRLLRQQLDAEPRGDGTTFRGMIDDSLVEGTTKLLEASGVLGMIARWREEDRQPVSRRGGAPAKLRSARDGDEFDNRDRAVLTLALVLQRLDRSPQLSEIASVIETQLSTRSLRLLDLPIERVGASGTYYRVTRAWKRLTTVINPLPQTDYKRRLSRAEVVAAVAAIDPEEATRKGERLRAVQNALLEGTWQLLDEKTQSEWQGDVSFDATPVMVWGKRGQRAKARLRPTDSMSPEWGADWHFMHNEPLAWGYSLHITVAVPDPYAPGRFPMLAIAASLDAPSVRSDDNAVTMLTSIVGRGHLARYAVSDRGYFSHCLAEKFHRPLIALGYLLVGDYKKTQRGKQSASKRSASSESKSPGTRGALFVEGNFYSPAMPQHLVDATKTYSADHDWATYYQRIEMRSRYLLKRHDEDRWSCPAVAKVATAKCPRRPDGFFSVNPGSRKPFVQVEKDPGAGHEVCSSQTVKIRPEELGHLEKLAQPLQYASPEWEVRYTSGRSIIEGFNGYAKDGKHEQVDKKVNRRVRGFAANALIAVIALAASNVRKIASFYARGKPLPMEPRPKVKDAASRPAPFWAKNGREGPGWLGFDTEIPERKAA